MTALMHASYWGHMETVRVLLTVPDIDINMMNEHVKKQLTVD